MEGPGNFCEERCPICTRSRQEEGYLTSIARGFVKLYWRLCPSCKARFKATGKKPWEK